MSIMSSASSSEFKLVHKTRNNTNANMKPFLLLKDYLKDDFSSCSSNGFKSFPRKQPQQQCCTSVRFLLDLDLQHSDFNTKKKSSSKRFSTRSRSISVLQRASGLLLNAVKLLPFSSTSSSAGTTTNNTYSSSSKGFLTKSFSRKLLKRRFWKKSFNDFLDEKELPRIDTIVIDTTTTTATSNSSGGTLSDSSNSWSGSEFTSAECLQVSPGRNSDSSSGYNVRCEIELPEKKCCTKVGAESKVDATVAATPSTTSHSVEPNAKKAWSTEEEKEQFSPVSVLDCPFDDQEEADEEEEETCLPFRHRLAQLEGKANKLKKKLRRFENLTELLEPVELEKRITLSELVTVDQLDTTTSMFIDIEQKVKIEVKAEDLLNIIKTRVPSENLLLLKSNKLFMDFFKEGMEKSWDEVDVVKKAEDWANGKPNEVVLLDWQVKEGRKAYIQDMEERGEWRREDNEMTQHVGVDIELGVWSSLVDELVSDICTYVE